MQNAVDALTKIIDSSEAGICVTDYHTGEILFVNNKLLSYGGPQFCVDEVIGKKCWSIMNMEADERCSFCPYKQLIGKKGELLEPYVWEHYFPLYNMWMRITSRVIEWIDGRLAHLETIYDINETKRVQEHLTSLAFIDQRLQLKNGLKLEQDMRQAQPKPSLMVFDIEALNKINEAYGRDVGDDLLLSLRDWILSQRIPHSELYRLSGEKFCLAINDIEEESLKALAEAMLYRFAETWFFGHNESRLHILGNLSLGIIHSDIIPEAEPLLNLIERVMKISAGKERVIVYDEQMDKDYKRRLQFELSLKRCMWEGMKGFDVYYQPIADPITGLWCGLEALCRWNSPELGTVSPQIFIPEAERLELIGVIGLWALETAVVKCKSWGLDKHERFILDVNLSALQFMDEMLAPKILKVLHEHDFPGDKLSIEITESTQFTFTDQSLNTIEILRDNNVLVALDDFGTGYSGFNNLKSLPVDIVKIERIFITDIEHDSYQQYLFRAMAELTHAADMKLIAEGVENENQMHILLKNGADLLQGYLFSKPLPPAQLETQLHNFYEVNESFRTIRHRKVNMKQLLANKEEYSFSRSLYKVVNRCMHMLLNSTRPDESIRRVLEMVAMYMGVSRAYIFLRDGGDCFCESHEWCSEGIPSQNEFFSSVPVTEAWLKNLKDDGVIHTTDLAVLSGIDDAPLLPRDVKSMVILPLWDGSDLSGFVGLDDCRYYRDWRAEEMMILHDVCLLISGVVNKQKLQEEVTRLSKRIG